jgi:chromosome segregation ATPase
MPFDPSTVHAAMDTLSTISGIAGGIATVGFLFMSARTNALKLVVDGLQGINNTLQARLDRLEKEHQELQADYEKLKATNASLEASYRALQSDYEVLKMAYTKAQEMICELQARVNLAESRRQRRMHKPSPECETETPE